jgi:hypothetical protein
VAFEIGYFVLLDTDIMIKEPAIAGSGGEKVLVPT